MTYEQVYVEFMKYRGKMLDLPDIKDDHHIRWLERYGDAAGASLFHILISRAREDGKIHMVKAKPEDEEP